MECYNVTIEEEHADPGNINIQEVEGHHIVEGQQIDNLDITTPLKTKQVNIIIEVELKIEKLEITGMMLLWIKLQSYTANISTYFLPNF